MDILFIVGIVVAILALSIIGTKRKKSNLGASDPRGHLDDDNDKRPDEQTRT